jgi:hypothetical protein
MTVNEEEIEALFRQSSETGRGGDWERGGLGEGRMGRLGGLGAF